MKREKESGRIENGGRECRGRKRGGWRVTDIRARLGGDEEEGWEGGDAGEDGE